MALTRFRSAAGRPVYFCRVESVSHGCSSCRQASVARRWAEIASSRRASAVWTSPEVPSDVTV